MPNTPFAWTRSVEAAKDRDVLGGMAAAESKRVSFVMERQRQTQWCWAAVATSFASFAGDASWDQCSVASSTLGRECCSEGQPVNCNEPWYLERALATVGQHDRMSQGQVAHNVIEAELDSRRALAIRVGWAGGGGHFLAITGIWSDQPSTVTVDDPWHGPATVTLDTLSGQYRGSGAWTHSYFTNSGEA